MSATELAKQLSVAENQLNNPTYFAQLIYNYAGSVSSYLQKKETDPTIDQNWQTGGPTRSQRFSGFAVGTNYVPQDMLAQIHEGEAIIPAPFNPERYAMASGNTALIEEIKRSGLKGRCVKNLKSGQTQ